MLLPEVRLAWSRRYRYPVLGPLQQELEFVCIGVTRRDQLGRGKNNVLTDSSVDMIILALVLALVLVLEEVKVGKGPNVGDSI